MYHNGSEVLLAKNRYSEGSYLRALLKLYDKTTKVQSHLAGVDIASNPGTWCSSGSSATCNMGGFIGDAYGSITYDSFDDHWIFAQHNTSTITRVIQGGSVSVLANIPRNIYSIEYLRNSDKSLEKVFYCATNGNLYQYDLNTSMETQLEFGIPNFQCTGYKIRYVASRNAIAFIYTYDNIHGIAEFKL